MRLLTTMPVLLLAACAGLPAAQMALPQPLTGLAPQTLQGIGAGRHGGFVLDGRPGRFDRSASRLSLFDSALAMNRGSVSYRYGSGDVDTVTASCRARETQASVGIVSAAPQPWALHCDFAGARQGGLDLAATSAVPGVTAERRGRVEFGGVTLTLQSVHRLQGSPLPVEMPIGYVFVHDGRPVGAVELNGAPRLWRPPAGSAVHDAVTHAALALALLWPDSPG